MKLNSQSYQITLIMIIGFLILSNGLDIPQTCQNIYSWAPGGYFQRTSFTAETSTCWITKPYPGNNNYPEFSGRTTSGTWTTTGTDNCIGVNQATCNNGEIVGSGYTCLNCFKSDSDGYRGVDCSTFSSNQCMCVQFNIHILGGTFGDYTSYNNYGNIDYLCVDIEEYSFCKGTEYCLSGKVISEVLNCEYSCSTTALTCEQCKTNYKLTETQQYCVDIITNCTIYKDNPTAKCKLCSSGHVTENEELCAFPIIENCAIYFNQVNSECKQCSTGTQTENNLYCVPKISNCLTYYDQPSQKCKICSQGIQTENSLYCVEEIEYCLKYYDEPSALCKACSQGFLTEDQLQCVYKLIQNCKTYSQNYNAICIECKDNYIKEDDGINIRCLQKCSEGFYFDQLQEICLQCNIEHCNSCSTKNICNSCNSQYTLFDNLCVKPKQDCEPYAYDFLKEKCVPICEMGFFFDTKNYICEKCQNIFKEGCSLCSEKECLNCEKGYLDKITKSCESLCSEGYTDNILQQKCIKCSNLHDSECKKCNTASCTQCNPGSFLDNLTNNCVQNVSSCSQNQVGQIIEEDNSYYGICIESCPTNLILDNLDYLCKECHQNCKEGKCEVPLNENYCYECLDN